jgi:hypothetical protein
MKLTSEKVREVYLSCQLQAEAEGKGTAVEGITGSFVLDTAGYETTIEALLAQLPSEFKQSGGGGGWSFLEACRDMNGNHWAGLHSIMEMLFVLGIAAGKAKWVFPRAMWGVLPGGMPYAVVLG